MTHNINPPQEPTTSGASRPSTPNSSHEPQIPRAAIPPTTPEQRVLNKTSEIAIQSVQREILVKKLEEWVRDTTATGNKAEAKNRILGCFDSKSTNLKLGKLELNKLPDCLRFLSHLERLDLSNNKISNFTILSDSLNNLQELDLTNNKINNFIIPSNSLNNLQALYLNSNQITNFTLPSGSLNNLQDLNIRGNQISTFTIPSDSLNNLQTLDLSNNQICNFTASSDSLNNLRSLNLQNNQIENVSISSDSLNNLRDFNLHNNQITNFTIPSNSLNMLRTLTLSDNQIENVSISSGSLNNLERLYLFNNEQLRTISMASELPELYFLGLENNPNLNELPLLLGRSPRLTNIEIDSSSTQLQSSADAILATITRFRYGQSKEKLPEELTFWKNYAKDSELDTTEVLKALTDDDQGVVYDWLARLSRSEDFQSNQRNLTSVVCHILKDLTNKDFRDLALTQMAANNEACHDRASMALNELYLSWKLVCGSSHLTIEERLEIIAKAGKTLALREAIANQLAGRTDIDESVETYLYYETHLADSLGLLTCIQNMSYARCAKPLDEQKLKDYVEEHYLKKAAEIPNLEEIMQKNTNTQELLNAIQNKYADEMENICNDNSLDSLEITKQCKNCQNNLEKEILDFKVAWLKERLSKKS